MKVITKALTFPLVIKYVRMFSNASPLKKYFAQRFSASTTDLVKYLRKTIQLESHKLLWKDHRWINLNITIQQHLSTFSLQQKFTMLKLLSGVDSGKETAVSIVKHIVDNITLNGNSQPLSLKQSVNLLWTLAKHYNHSIDLVKVICDIITINLQSINQSTHSSFNQFTQIIKICWALQKLDIRDDGLMKQLILVIKNNVVSMQINHLCSLWSYLVRLGLSKKRFVISIKNIIKQNHQQLVNLELLVFQTLIHTFTILPTNHIPKIPDQLNPNNIVSDQKFVLWLCETIFLRSDKHLDYRTAYLLLNAFEKYQIFDYPIFKQIILFFRDRLYLMKVSQMVSVSKMLIKIINKYNNTNNQKVFTEQLNQFTKRIFDFFKIMKKTQKRILFNLYNSGMLHPPPNIIKLFLKQFEEFKVVDEYKE